jgi:hypothetical protein
MSAITLGNEIYCILVDDVPGQEGSILGVVVPPFGISPAITGTRATVPKLVQIARLAGRKFRVVCFSYPEDVTAEF